MTDDEAAKKCSKLWASVLQQAARDASSDEDGVTDPRDRKLAKRWFAQGGKHFDLVCHLAGFEDPEDVRAAYHAGKLTGAAIGYERREK